MLALLAALSLSPAARAQSAIDDWEYMAWEKLYDARLNAATGMAAPQVNEDFQRALSQVRDEPSPYLADIHYWRALALLTTGEVSAAADEIALIGPREVLSDRDRALLAQVDIAERQIRRLPLHEDFSDAADAAPWIRSPQRAGMRDLGLTDLDGDRVVVWTTVVQNVSDDAIMLAFADRGPSRIRMRLRADRFSANMRGRLEDDEGQQWTARIPTVSTRDWVEVQLSLSDFALVGDPFGRPPDPRSLRSFLLMDVTGYRGEESGENRIYIDDLDLLP